MSPKIRIENRPLSVLLEFAIELVDDKNYNDQRNHKKRRHHKQYNVHSWVCNTINRLLK